MLKTVVGLSLVLTLILAGCATVPQERYDTLLAEKNRLEAEKESLSQKYDDLVQAMVKSKDEEIAGGGAIINADKLRLNSQARGRADYDSGEVGWWEIEIEEEGKLTVSVEIQEADEDLDIELYGKVDGSAEEAEIEEIKRDVESGIYYLKIFGYESGNASEYALSTTFEAKTAGIENARELPIGSQMEDIVDLQEKDWWSIEIVEEGQLKVVVNILQSGQDLDLELYDENKELVTESAEETEIEEMLADVTPGVYYLKVFGYEGENASDYTIAGSFESTTAGIENAMELNLGSEVQDRIDLAEKDWWRIAIGDGGELNIVLNILQAEQDLDIELYNEDNELVAESAGEEATEEITVGVSAGTYYLKVLGYEGGNASDYTLAGSLGSFTSRLGDAMEFPLGSQVEDGVGYGEEDWWKIAIGDGGELNIVLSIFDSTEDLDLELYNEDGELVAESAGETDTEEITIEVSTGIYYLKVLGFEGESGSDYLLSNSLR